MITKVCTKCKEIKLVSDFCKDKYQKDGLYPRCMECRRIHGKLWRERKNTQPEHRNKLRRKARERYWRIRSPDWLKRKCEYEKRRLKDRNLIYLSSAERKYKISREWYETQLTRQNGLCAICGQPETTKNARNPNLIVRLSIDHNHKTGQIRKLLCHKCNVALGAFREDINILKNATAYLQEFEEKLECVAGISPANKKVAASPVQLLGQRT